MSKKRINWGIIGLGGVAHEFAMGLKNSEHSHLYGVGSRSIETAKEFCHNYEADVFYGSYEELAQNPDIDIIYIATPHVFHKENTLLCLNAGKHVLCEKPFTLSGADAQEMVTVAKEKGLFLMEALWSRFFPLMDKVREILDQKLIGDIVSIDAEFGFKAAFDPDSRLFNKELGGGALFDIGIYLISLAHMVLGVPERIEAGADIGVTDIDERCTMILRYPNDALARLGCTITEEKDGEAKIVGTAGSITICSHFWRPERMVVEIDGKGLEEFLFDIDGNGYNYEAEAVSEALLNGETEHAHMPLQGSVEILNIIDEIRKQITF